MNNDCLIASPGDSGWVRLSGDDERIEATDCVRIFRDRAEGVLRLDRVIGQDGREYGWDNPGARFRFRTDSTEVVAHLVYRARRGGEGTAAHNGIGLCRVDGRDAGRFERALPAGWRDGGCLDVRFPVAADAACHDYELILPYADAVALAGVSARAGSGWGRPTPRPATRWLAFGDSVTQGFTASSITETYAFRMAEALDWTLINAGIGGRGCRGEDGVFLGGIGADVVTVAIGVNDWQGGRSPADYARDLRALLLALRRGNPTAPITVISPLWVHDGWKPAGAVYSIGDYRIGARGVVSELIESGVAGLDFVEGTDLIDPDATRFDDVAVHPNDAGFAQMADRLAAVLRAAPFFQKATIRRL